MIIILEGANRCGKTSLAKYLVPEFGYRYFDPDVVIPNDCLPTVNVGKFKIWSETRIQTIVDMIPFLDRKTPLIIDRLHLTEAVYGITKRNYATSLFFQRIDYQLRSMSQDIRLIYCSDDIENLKERNLKEPDISELHYTFEEYFHWSALKKIKVNVKEDQGEILKFLDEYTVPNDNSWEEIFTKQEKCIV